MKKKALQTISKHNLIEKGMHIVVGLSGGPDSVCLFDILRELSRELELGIYAVHINHQLRPGDAEEDQKYVEELCQKYDIPCYVFVEDCNALAIREGLTSEEAGRKIRYEAFGHVAAELYDKGIPKDKIAIALAHNANDQAETILFRIMRGTGTDGLAGIPYKRYEENGFAVVRPILDFKREEIEKYCEDRELHPRIDHTNNENVYARNKIRNMLIPFIQENFNEGIIDTINRLGQIAAGDREYMNNEAMAAFKKAAIAGGEGIAFDKNILESLHGSIRFRVYTSALTELGLEQNITFAQGELIDKVLMSKSPSAMCDLTDGFVVLREYEHLIFRRKSTNVAIYKATDIDSKESHRVEQDDERIYRFTTMTMSEFDEFRQSHTSYVYGAFQGVELKDLCIRTRKAGDTINTGNGTKKIQDFFVDQKVPKHCRDEIKMLAKGSKILWVLPSPHFMTENMQKKGRFSADFRVGGECAPATSNVASSDYMSPEINNMDNNNIPLKEPNDVVIVLEIVCAV